MKFLISPLTCRLLLSLFLLVTVSTPMAEDTVWSLEHLMKQLRSIGERHAKFTEVRELALLDQPIKQTGTLQFLPPDRLIRTLSPPSNTRYEIEANQLTLWQDDEQQILLLDNLPELLAFSASFRSVLGGDMETLNTYFTATLTGDANTWTLTLIPKDKDFAKKISHIEITGREVEIDRYLVVETSGDQTVTHLIPIRDDS
jgi:outer membrane lipoprotein-sorting protein